MAAKPHCHQELLIVVGRALLKKGIFPRVTREEPIVCGSKGCEGEYLQPHTRHPNFVKRRLGCFDERRVRNSEDTNPKQGNAGTNKSEHFFGNNFGNKAGTVHVQTNDSLTGMESDFKFLFDGDCLPPELGFNARNCLLYGCIQ